MLVIVHSFPALKQKKRTKKIPSNLKIEIPFFCFPFKTTTVKSQEMLKLVRLFVSAGPKASASSYKKGFQFQPELVGTGTVEIEDRVKKKLKTWI